MDSQSEKTQHGYLLIADISGYTSFVAGTELEHAHEILTELLELLVGRLTAGMILSKLEGDAVFVFAPESKISRGETVLELIESTYVAFRDRREAVRRRTTCVCNACRAIPTLDLKFIAHHGDYIAQSVSGIHELVGSDVNLIHRLLKNHVGEKTGWKAYALFTGQGLEHMGIYPAGMRDMVENYEHLGDVQTYSLDLHERYQELTDARRVVVAPEEADVTIVHDYPAPPPMVWDWLNDPFKRTQWKEGTKWRLELGSAGRTGVGARNHCAHGGGESIETILGWRPFDYFTTESVEGVMVITDTTYLEPLPNGFTRMRVYARVKTLLPSWLNRPVVRFLFANVFRIPSGFAHMERLMAHENAKQAEPGLAGVAAAGAIQ